MNNNNDTFFKKVKYNFLIEQPVLSLVIACLKERFDVDDKREGRKYIVIEEKGKPEEREKVLTRDEKAIREEIDRARQAGGSREER